MAVVAVVWQWWWWRGCDGQHLKTHPLLALCTTQPHTAQSKRLQQPMQQRSHPQLTQQRELHRGQVGGGVTAKQRVE